LHIISEHHRNRLKELESQLGSVERLAELHYRIQIDNSWQLCKEFGVPMYIIRYLTNLEASKACVCYVYERTHKQELKLIYSDGVRMVA